MDKRTSNPKQAQRKSNADIQRKKSSGVSIGKDQVKTKQSKNVTQRNIPGGQVTTTVLTKETEKETGRGKWALYSRPEGIILAVVAAVTILASMISPCMLPSALRKVDPRTQSRPDLHKLCQNTPGHDYDICTRDTPGCYQSNYMAELSPLCKHDPKPYHEQSKCRQACSAFHTRWMPMFLIGYATCVVHIVGGLVSTVLILLSFTATLGLLIGVVSHAIALIGAMTVYIMARGWSGADLLVAFPEVIEVLFDPHPMHNIPWPGKPADAIPGHFWELDADPDYLRQYQKEIPTLKTPIIVEVVVCIIATLILTALLLFFCLYLKNRIK